MTRRFALGLCAAVTAILACNTLLPPRPELRWDTSPDALIIEAWQGGGLVPMNYVKNYIPEARVWGDGRIVWVEYTSGGGRRVLEGHLSTQQMTDLLQEFSDAGFFGWKASYQPSQPVFDAGTTTLSVNLLATRKSVSEYAGEGAPEKFHDLLRLLAGGTGASGTDVVPTRGYLTAFRMGPASGQAGYHWPESSLGYDLGTAVSGRYIEGEALAFAWKVLNENQYVQIESNGADYQITLQVPGLSGEEPPAP